MPTVQSSRLIAEINNLLSYPLGSASHVLSDEVIQRREQLKQLRFQLENAQDPRRIKTLEQKCQLLIYQLDGTLDSLNDSLADAPETGPEAPHPEKLNPLLNTTLDTLDAFGQDDSSDHGDQSDLVAQINQTEQSNQSDLPDLNILNINSSDRDDLEDRGEEGDREAQFPKAPPQSPELLRLITISPPPAPEHPPSQNGNTTNEIFDRTMLENDEQVVSIQQTVKLAIEQTLAVERALMIAEINGNIKNLVEAQRRAALSQELQELEQQKQALRAEIANLELQRQGKVQQFNQQLDRQQQEAIAQITERQQAQINLFAEQQKLYQTEISNSIMSLQELVRDRIPSEVEQVIQEIRAEEVKRWQDVNISHQEFMERVQSQKDRFTTDLDTRFASTFAELEQNIQTYKDSLAHQVEQVQAYEREHEALLATLSDHLAAQVKSLPISTPSPDAIELLLEPELEPELLSDQPTDFLSELGSESEVELFPDESTDNLLVEPELEELFPNEQVDESIAQKDALSESITLFTDNAIGDRDEGDGSDAIQGLISESEIESIDLFADDVKDERDDLDDSDAIEDLINESNDLFDEDTRIAGDDNSAAIDDLIAELDSVVETSNDSVESVSSDEELEDELEAGSQSKAEIEPQLDLQANPEFKALASQIESEFSQELNQIIHHVRPGEKPNMASYDVTTNVMESDLEIATNLSPEINTEINHAIADLPESPAPVSSMDDELDRLLNAVVQQSADESAAEAQMAQELPDLLPSLETETKLSELADAEALTSEFITSNSLYSAATQSGPVDSLDKSSKILPEKSSSNLPPEDGIDPSYSIDDTWFLGIDFGSTSLRASLFNATTGKLYPLLFELSGQSNDYLPSTGYVAPEPLPLDPLQALSIDTPDANYSDTIAIANFKKLLKLGLPYRGVSTWQPIVQWAEQERIPLRYFQALLKQLLLNLQTTAICSKLPDLHTILSKRIFAVILGHPTAWPDTYVHNLREVVLATEIVDRAEQVMVIDQAIAPLFALIQQNQAPQDITLAINIGAQTTDILLAKAVNGVISRGAIATLGFDYAGLSINQDIVVQLLYPRWRLLASTESDVCDLDRLLMPAPGDPAPSLRAELQKCLMSSSVGRELLNAAEQLKLELSTHLERDEWVATIGDRPLTVWRREIESQVMQPFTQYLNRELNDLLSSSGVLADEVKSLWKLGGSATLTSLSRWLEHKFPNAEIERLPSATVASGLAIAPMYRYLINIARQQYSDYFLLQEICRLNLQSAITPTQLMQKLQNRGINSKSCRDRILTFLQGDLPMGLFPWQEQEQGIFLSDPALSHDLFAGRLFELESNGTYQPNLRKFQHLKLYLQSILGNMQQSLTEPLLFPEFGRTAIQSL